MKHTQLELVVLEDKDSCFLINTAHPEVFGMVSAAFESGSENLLIFTEAVLSRGDLGLFAGEGVPSGHG